MGINYHLFSSSAVPGTALGILISGNISVMLTYVLDTVSQMLSIHYVLNCHNHHMTKSHLPHFPDEDTQNLRDYGTYPEVTRL